MADGIGQIPTPVMERLAAAAAAEPYESVSCAFVSYGSCAKDLADGWKYRSRLWYGVNLSPSPAPFGGGGSGWDFWKSLLEKDANGYWIELPLVKKSMEMLQALLLDESGHGGGLGNFSCVVFIFSKYFFSYEIHTKLLSPCHGVMLSFSPNIILI